MPYEHNAVTLRNSAPTNIYTGGPPTQYSLDKQILYLQHSLKEVV